MKAGCHSSFHMITTFLDSRVPNKNRSEKLEAGHTGHISGECCLLPVYCRPAGKKTGTHPDALVRTE